MKLRNDELDSFYPETYVINHLLSNYFESIGVKEPTETDISEKKIKSNESFLRRYRIDTNLPEDMKNDLKELSQVLQEKKMVDRKLSYYDIVNTLYKKYLESYPDIKQALLEYKYIKQQMGFKKLQDQSEKKKYGDY